MDTTEEPLSLREQETEEMYEKKIKLWKEQVEKLAEIAEKFKAQRVKVAVQVGTVAFIGGFIIGWLV